jgi:predicted lipase
MNPLAKNFDLANAIELAQASADAYRLAPTVYDTATDTQVRITEVEDCVIIAFRGSSSVKDWILDAEFFRTTFRFLEDLSGQVHTGFLTAFSSIHAELASNLKTRGLGNAPIFVTGHSLGGALAILCALELSREGYNLAQVVTFGQPRVGNKAFKAIYDARLGDKTFRVVNEEDIVARLPHLPSFTDLYWHVGSEAFITWLDDEPVINPSRFRLLLSDILGIYRAWKANGPIAMADILWDHKLDKYQSRLERMTHYVPR